MCMYVYNIYIYNPYRANVREIWLGCTGNMVDPMTETYHLEIHTTNSPLTGDDFFSWQKYQEDQRFRRLFRRFTTKNYDQISVISMRGWDSTQYFYLYNVGKAII